MEIIHNILHPDFRLGTPSTVTIGNFDGLHRGHASIIEKLIQSAKTNATQPVLITFEPHPTSVVAPNRTPMLLSSTREKLKLLEDKSLRSVILFPFDNRISQYTAEWFLEEVLIKRLGTKHVVIGINHTFGKNREGNADYLRRILPSKGIGLDVVDPVCRSGEMVSSSAVRSELHRGSFDLGVKMLDHPYPLFGQIVTGTGTGAALGYPTINIRVGERKLVPLPGVYACRVEWKGEIAGGMLYIGTRPTFGGKSRSIEISCFRKLDIKIGDCLESYVVKFFRADIKFESKTALIEQIKKDEEEIGSFLNHHRI